MDLVAVLCVVLCVEGSLLLLLQCRNACDFLNEYSIALYRIGNAKNVRNVEMVVFSRRIRVR